MGKMGIFAKLLTIGIVATVMAPMFFAVIISCYMGVARTCGVGH